MSYGALSGNAISALNLGARLARCYHNTGEGGISKFHKGGGADLVWNVGTGYFACGASLPDGSRVFDPQMFTENARLDSVRMIEIKLSQGAKPAHGGGLPSAKITPHHCTLTLTLTLSPTLSPTLTPTPTPGRSGYRAGARDPPQHPPSHLASGAPHIGVVRHGKLLSDHDGARKLLRRVLSLSGPYPGHVLLVRL